MNLYSSRSNSGKKKISCYIKNILKYNESDLGNKFKKIKLKSKIETNSILNKFHRKIIEKKYKYHTRPKLLLETENSSDFFLTKLNKSQKNNNQTTTIFSNRTRSLSDRNHSIIKNLKLYTSKININNVYPTIEHKMPFRFNKMISSCLESSERRNFNKETLSQFNQRIKTSYLFNITQQNLLKRYNEIKENKDFKIQEVKMKIFMIEDCKKKLEIFIKNLNKYVNFLYHTINKEKNIINQLYSQECELEISNLRLFNLIKQKKLLLELYKQYKIFLILVKYKKTKIGEIPEKELKKYGIEFKKDDSSFNIFARRSTKRISYISMGSISSSRKGSISSKNIVKQKSIKKKNINKLNINDLILKNKNKNIINIPIFDSPDEFIYKMNDLENKVKELFSIFSEIKYNINDLYKSNNENELDKKNEIINFSMYEETLNELKKRNKILEMKYKYLLNKLKQSNEEKLFLKIKKILISLPINIEIDFQIMNFYGKINNNADTIIENGKSYNKCIYGLTVLENVLVYYQNFIKNVIKDSKIKFIFDKILKELERKKRNDKSIKIKLRFETNSDDEIKNIRKTNNNTFLPIRKIDIYDNLIERKKFEKEEKKKKLKMLKNQDDIEYENWIVY